MPILLEYVEQFWPKSVLEFGSGNYSTKLFVTRFKLVVSIEMESEEWFNKVSASMSGLNSSWTYRFIPKFEDVALFVGENYGSGTFDLVFVDDGESRAPEANLAFGLAETVVVHDAQHRWRDEICPPEEYHEVNFTRFPIVYPEAYDMYDNRPWTTMYTRNPAVEKHFRSVSEEHLYARFTFPYVYDEPPQTPGD